VSDPKLPGFGVEGVGFTVPGAGPDHDGATYEAALDHVRLNAQMLRVWEALRESDAWWTLSELAAATGDPEASVSARIRDLRKDKFGGHVIERLRVDDSGLYRYHLIPNPHVDVQGPEGEEA
jgi:hypothetical protein